MLATLRQRNFALLWFGGLISIIGDWILYAALPFYIYERTHSTLATAGMIAAGLIPRLLLGSVAGVFVDRWDRKRLIVIANLLQTVGVLLLLLVQSDEWLWMVYLVSFLQALLAIFFSPAETALLPRLVGEEHLLTANLLNALNENLGRLIGPPIGGIILSVFGLNGVIFIDSLSFLLAALLIAWITTPRAANIASSSARSVRENWAKFWNEWLEGLRIVRDKRTIAAIFTVLVLMSFGGIMIDPLFAPFVHDILQAGAEGFGWLLTARAAGGIFGGLIIGRFGKNISPVNLIGWGSIVAGLLLLVEYNVPFFPLALTIAFLVGLPAVVSGSAAQTLIQRDVPNAYMGRVLGALGATTSLLSLVSVLGLAGELGQLVGIVPMLNVAVGITIFSGVLGLAVLTRRAPVQLDLAQAGEPLLESQQPIKH